MAQQKSEKGSAFFYILIAIVLFAALTYAVSNSNRTNINIVTEEQAKIAAQEAIEQAETVKNAVQKLLLRKIDETSISFENSAVTGYTLSSCTNDFCKVFNNNGGAINWIQVPQNSNDGTDWIYTGTLPILGNGSDARYDITMILPKVSDNICRQINVFLGYSNNLSDPIPVPDDTTLGAQKISTANPLNAASNFIDGTNIDGTPALCVQIPTPSIELGTTTNSNYFVYTLYAG